MNKRNRSKRRAGSGGNNDLVKGDDTHDIVASLQCGKAMFERATFLQNHIGALCSALSEYSLKSAVVRDKNDDLALTIAKFANDEYLNTTAKLSLKVVAELIASLGDHRNAEVKRIEAKVVPTLAGYGNICKYLKNDIKAAISSLDRENSYKRNVDRLVNKIGDSPKGQSLVEVAESEYEKALAQSSRLQHLSREQMLKFEQKRLQDLKDCLMGFFKIEIAMHSRSLEILTDAYKYVESIDEDADLKVLKTELGFPNSKDEYPESKCKGISKKKKSAKETKGQRSSEDEIEVDENWRFNIERKLERLMSLDAIKLGDYTSKQISEKNAKLLRYSCGDTTDDESESSKSSETEKCQRKAPRCGEREASRHHLPDKLSPRIEKGRQTTCQNGRSCTKRVPPNVTGCIERIEPKSSKLTGNEKKNVRSWTNNKPDKTKIISVKPPPPVATVKDRSHWSSYGRASANNTIGQLLKQ